MDAGAQSSRSQAPQLPIVTASATRCCQIWDAQAPGQSVWQQPHSPSAVTLGTEFVPLPPRFSLRLAAAAAAAGWPASPLPLPLPGSAALCSSAAGSATATAAVLCWAGALSTALPNAAETRGEPGKASAAGRPAAPRAPPAASPAGWDVDGGTCAAPRGCASAVPSSPSLSSAHSVEQAAH